MTISTMPTIALYAIGTAVVWFATLEFITEERTKARMARIESAIIKLVKELNTIEASGDYERAKRLTEKYTHRTSPLPSMFLPASISVLPACCVIILDTCILI